VSLYQSAVTRFDLVVNRAAKLTESRASGDHAMAVAAFRYALRGSYRDCCQDKENQNKHDHTKKALNAALVACVYAHQTPGGWS